MVWNRLLVTAAHRGPQRLPHPRAQCPSEPSIAEVCAAAPLGNLLLSGGEPTLRGDLPDLLSALGHRTLGLQSDGLALSHPSAWSRLAPVRLLRIPLHSLRPDAHDWLVGLPGAARRVRQTIEVAQTTGREVEVEVAWTRPTALELPELVRGLHTLGVRTIRLVWWEPRGEPEAVSVQPRPGLAENALLSAIQTARTLGLRFDLIGIPACAAPGIGRSHLRSEDPTFAPASLAGLGAAWAPGPRAQGCGRCPPACPGFAQTWVDLFGRTEIDSERGGPRPEPGPHTPPTDGSAAARAPNARGGRPPSTRPRALLPLLHRKPSATDPLLGDHQPPPDLIRIRFSGTSRQIRTRLIQIAQESPKQLWIDDPDALRHPAGYALLREALRLGISEVGVRADPSPLADLPDRSLVRLTGLRWWVDPRGGSTTDPALLRLARLSRCEIGGEPPHHPEQGATIRPPEEG